MAAGPAGLTDAKRANGSSAEALPLAIGGEAEVPLLIARGGCAAGALSLAAWFPLSAPLSAIAACSAVETGEAVPHGASGVNVHVCTGEALSVDERPADSAHIVCTQRLTQRLHLMLEALTLPVELAQLAAQRVERHGERETRDTRERRERRSPINSR
eukprot:scaffold202230_cov31-Tisochrysis_lutea.AAC.1